MFEDKLERADNEFGLFEILRCIREVYGIDSELEIDDDDRIGVIFTLKEREHFMLVDEIVFNEESEIGDKIDLILDELRYAFQLEDTPIIELAKGIMDVFLDVEKQDPNEEVQDVIINVICEDTVEVSVINNETGETKELHAFIGEDVTYENGYILGCKIGCKMLAELLGLCR